MTTTGSSPFHLIIISSSPSALQGNSPKPPPPMSCDTHLGDAFCTRTLTTPQLRFRGEGTIKSVKLGDDQMVGWESHVGNLTRRPGNHLRDKCHETFSEHSEPGHPFHVSHDRRITVEDVGCIQGFLLLLQNVHVEGSSVANLVITVHRAPARQNAGN